jgi:hypothetical protein
MSIQLLFKKAKNRISFVCLYSAELRKGKSIDEISQHDAFIIANKKADTLYKRRIK